MKLACQLSTSSSMRRFTSATLGACAVQALQERVSLRLAPRPCQRVPSGFRMRLPETWSAGVPALEVLPPPDAMPPPDAVPPPAPAVPPPAPPPTGGAAEIESR